MTTLNDLRILGIILARGGSKRLPGKNLKVLHGKPLLAWSIEAAQASRALSRIVLSTDAQAIADVGLQYGIDVPFLRPPQLAADNSTSADAVSHALDFLREQQGLEFDAVILLEPTSPLRASGDIDAIAELLASHWDETDAVVSVGEVQLEKPDVMKVFDQSGYLSKWGDAASAVGGVDPPAPCFPYGVAYAVKTSALMQWKTFYPPRVMGYKIQRWQNYEVDDEFDFACVEAIIQYFKGELP